MTRNDTTTPQRYVLSENSAGSSSVVLVCEHACHHIPEQFNGLGLSPDASKSHAAWDPGAMAIAQILARQLDAPLIASGVSRLVYDCNRPPDAPDAMPSRSELIGVPGNIDLSQADRDVRTDAFYRPFQATLRERIQQTNSPIIVTIHSFTPVYHRQNRAVEIGVLHDQDTRLADALLETAKAHTAMNVQRNQPYGPDDGVTHTLREHAINAGHHNVMLEIRNDLIETPQQQQAMGDMVVRWIVDACALINADGVVKCRA